MRILKFIPYLGILVLVFIIAFFGYRRGQNSRDREIADLARSLTDQRKTTEVYQGLYESSVIELKNINALLDTSQKSVEEMKKRLLDSGAQLLTTQQLVVKWKKAYQAALAASQREQPPGDQPSTGVTPVARKVVDFSGRLGPMKASGYTITDPPEAFLTIEQLEPLRLSVSVAQNRDRTWSSYVTSSDPNVSVDVVLAGVNPLIMSPRWYERLWLNTGAGFLGDPAATVGISYQGDRYSFGPLCYATYTAAKGCGVSFGMRLFK